MDWLLRVDAKMSTIENNHSSSDETSMNDKSPDAASKDKAISAIMISAVIVGGFVVYWVSEIEAVREMLKLAYG